MNAAHRQPSANSIPIVGIEKDVCVFFMGGWGIVLKRGYEGGDSFVESSLSISFFYSRLFYVSSLKFVYSIDNFKNVC